MFSQFFVQNFCTLQFFSQKFAQKNAQIFYGSYMVLGLKNSRKNEKVEQNL